ncbi:hypothetical protein RclHR1_08110004 [Rhizophagus clarus]|uniref:Uncharacterized protein n=1 Tax=Rhizophagus clarus TaxID=94130 RepID=A0A2Z6RZZ1_9GLOM|nr:hypothetical protein RclHR1_08110004 [Rhizophagus clarus]GES73469.1 hypothetical protein GLOIN_2v1824133 [Rhizophagus clarus]
MISRKLPFLAIMVALFCVIFIGLTQTAPLNKRQDDTSALADFNDDLVGRITWTNDVRVLGQFTKGLEKDTNINNYGFFIITKKGKKIDFTKDIRKKVTIFPSGGTSPYQGDFKSFTVQEIVGGTFFVTHKGKKFRKALIKQ